MQRYAIVEQGVVMNVALWDGETGWRPEAGFAAPCPDWVSPGCRFENGVFENGACETSGREAALARADPPGQPF